MARRIFFVVLVGIPLVLFLVFIDNYLSPYSEARDLGRVSWSQARYSDYFTTLANTKGALYAFETLRRTDFQAPVNTHGIGHAIGRVLYGEKGLGGMSDCTEEFRSACAHSIVIHAFAAQGPGALQAIVGACKRAPGGQGAFTICVHGLGHGILAYLEYDFSKAVRMCADVAPDMSETERPHRFASPYNECIGGMVMEMGQGAHDETLWGQMAPLYIPVSDPLMPCTSDFLPREGRAACYEYVTERLLVAVGAPEILPPPEYYPRAQSLCEKAPSEYRGACYAGFGKEFVFYATQLDSKDVNRLSDKALMNIRTWCAGSENDVGIEQCNRMALDSLFWAGENNPRSAASFCRIAPSRSHEACYRAFIENVSIFLKGNEKETACSLVPEALRSVCRASDDTIDA